ncbi:MAG TPA: hypothetical protein DGG95_17620 [Cytophagales bacterium]|jgi:hypothetical protein|nr:hypothetical protein [Cytophagales bacterium]
MKFYLSILALVLIQAAATAQTNTTTELDKKYDGFSLYFYKNTLRMLNQTDNKEFDEMIKDIEKMKFLIIDKTKSAFAAADYKKLLKGYAGEKYEEMMTSRYKGKNMDVYIRQESNRIKGTVILVSDSSSLYVLDILGRIALDKSAALFKVLDENTDIGQKLKDFAGDDDSKKKNKKEHGIKVD